MEAAQPSPKACGSWKLLVFAEKTPRDLGLWSQAPSMPKTALAVLPWHGDLLAVPAASRNPASCLLPARQLPAWPWGSNRGLPSCWELRCPLGCQGAHPGPLPCLFQRLPAEIREGHMGQMGLQGSWGETPPLPPFLPAVQPCQRGAALKCYGAGKPTSSSAPPSCCGRGLATGMCSGARVQEGPG